MTRISTAGQSQFLLDALLQRQSDVRESSDRVATLKTSTTFQGIARDATTLLATKETEGRTLKYLETNRLVESQLELYDTSLQQLANIGQAVRESVIGALNTGSPIALVAEIEASFQDAVSLLNIRFNGQYLFSGTRVDQPPVSADTPSGLLALAQTSDAFSNNTARLQARISDNTVLEFGVLADEVGTDLFEAIRRILQFDSGTLPSGAGAFAPAGQFSDPMTNAQRDFLAGELAGLEQVAKDLNEIVASNGVKMRRVADLQQRHEDDRLFLRKLIGDIEEVDPAEAVTKLNDDRLALEATMQILVRLDRLNLLSLL